MPDFMPYYGALFERCLPVYYEDDADCKGRGIRNKVRRYQDTVQHYLNVTTRNVSWNVESILPDIPDHIIESWTQVCGWGALIRKSGKYHFVSGICAGWGGQLDEWYIPSTIIVTNPYSKDKIDGEYTLGKDAVLLRNDTCMQGLLPIICPAAELLTESAVTSVCGLQNLRIINIIRTANDNIKQAAERFLKLIRWGRAGIITGTQQKTWSGSTAQPAIETLPINGVPPNYLNQIIEMTQYQKAALLNTLGIQNNPNFKRERLTDDEVKQNAALANPLIDNMKACRQSFCDEVKRVFDVDISFELTGEWSEEERMLEQLADVIEQPADDDTQAADEGGADNAGDTDDA